MRLLIRQHSPGTFYSVDECAIDCCLPLIGTPLARPIRIASSGGFQNSSRIRGGSESCVIAGIEAIVIASDIALPSDLWASSCDDVKMAIQISNMSANAFDGLFSWLILST